MEKQIEEEVQHLASDSVFPCLNNTHTTSWEVCRCVVGESQGREGSEGTDCCCAYILCH